MNESKSEIILLSRTRRNPNIDPRKGRNKLKYARLVESIRENGVLQPILARPVHDDPAYDYEVVAGNTRYLGSIDCEKETIPALIREMTDQEARICAALENQDRDDLTPIEEALNAVTLLADMANNHDEVMKRLGWSRSKLDQRVLLSHACHEVAEALQECVIKIGHADLLCRLPQDLQKIVLARIIETGMSVGETRNRLMTLTRDISTARFDTAACRNCLHNSGANADLFETNLDGSKCQNAVCWNAKTEQLIEVRLIEAQKEYGVTHTDLTLPPDSYVRLEAQGVSGIGEQQAAACVTCSNYGAVVSTSAGTEGEIAGGYCFDRNCNSQKQTEYKALIAQASNPVPTTPPQEGNANSGPKLPDNSGQETAPNKTDNKPAAKVKEQAVQPAQLKRSIRRQAFNLYSRMAVKIVQEDQRLALAIAVVSTYFDVRNDLPSELRKKMENGLGIKGHVSGTERAKLEIALAQRPEADLLRLLGSVAATTVYRTDSTDQFDKSVSGSQSLAFIEHANADPTSVFLMSEDYLKAQVKAGVVEDCKRSGFVEKYNGVHGEKAFEKLASGKSDDLIKAIIAFTEFSWAGYLPDALQITSQGGKPAAKKQAA